MNDESKGMSREKCQKKSYTISTSTLPAAEIAAPPRGGSFRDLFRQVLESLSFELGVRVPELVWVPAPPRREGCSPSRSMIDLGLLCSA